jgi:DNA helicase-2/ATP-dependent DNA helicase PcrA
VVEAPAGCGKTFQAANYAVEVAENISSCRVLVLTHTHAAVSVFSGRTRHLSNQIEIRTIDSLIGEVASAYHLSLDLPQDVGAWVRQEDGRFELLANKVRGLVQCNKFIAKKIAQAFPVIICDEHQDTSADQEGFIMCIFASGNVKLRIFGDPMQCIIGGNGANDFIDQRIQQWERLKSQASFAVLDRPHRWINSGNHELGAWVMDARNRLIAGDPIVLPTRPVTGLQIKFSENANSPQAYKYRPQFEQDGRRAINMIVRSREDALLLASSNDTLLAMRSAFPWLQVPIWEGHTRKALDALVSVLSRNESSEEERARAYIEFLKSCFTGFTARFADVLLRQAINPLPRLKGQLPPLLEEIAAEIRAGFDHRAFAQATKLLQNFVNGNVAPFDNLTILHPVELRELTKLSEYEDLGAGLANISAQWSRVNPKPSPKSWCTIHKSKGLEAPLVVINACDRKHFPNDLAKRNLLYVALSRATHQLTIFISRNSPSPLIRFE